MGAGGIEPELLEAWLTGRSLARGLPLPLATQGGFRIETDSDTELRRWIFPADSSAIADLAPTISSTREPIKACVATAILSARLPASWSVTDSGSFMQMAVPVPEVSLPKGFVAQQLEAGASGEVRIRRDNGDLAAHGYWGQGSNAFVYDRITVEPAYRRRGLGTALMGLIGRHCRDASLPRLLVATAQGRLLYRALGWEVLSPYSTGFLRSVT